MSVDVPTASCPSAGRRALWVVALAWGAQAIVTQSLLLREAMVLMSGSELVWGILLCAWLAGVATGAWIGGRLARRASRAERRLTIALLLLGVLACASIWGFRESRVACGIGPGELLSLGTMVIVAISLVLPCGFVVGMAFPLASAIADRAHTPGAGISVNRIYALESAGSLIGGALFTFWTVEHLSPIQTVLICIAITGAALAVLLVRAGSQRMSVVVVAGFAAGAALAACLAGPAINQFLVERRWRGLSPKSELVAEAESRYQNLAVGRMAEQCTLYCDGQISASFPDPFTFVPLAHFWMCQHPSPRHVLLLGGAAEGLLTEILKHPVEHVDCVEPDPRQIDMILPLLPEQDRTALQDRRVAVHHVDGRLFVKKQQARFDLVIARLPEPTSALRARFFTREFFYELKRNMHDQSVLCLMTAASPARLPAESARYLAGVRNTIATYFPEVIVGWGDPAHIVAATQKDLVSTDPVQLTERYQQRRIESGWFDPQWFSGAVDWFPTEKVAQRAAELDVAVGAMVSTDQRPIVYMHRLALWEKMTAAHSRRFIEPLLGLRWWQAASLLAGAAVATLLVHKAFGRSISEGVVIFSVGSTGFATMSLSIVWLFAFQNLYGYVYQWIGWIVAVFMGGLVIGCAWAGRVALAAFVPGPGREARLPVSRQVPLAASFLGPEQGACLPVFPILRRLLIIIDLLMAVLAALAPLLLPVLGRVQTSPASLVLVQVSILVLVLLTGILGGAAFALASGLHQAVSGRPKATASAIVGADHAGACLGALVTGILLVPVLGIATTALLLGGTKCISACLLPLVRKAAS
ncbi:MAG: fused MFS/spermidine synthase [Phycisphaerae bacterium]